jgi:predicted AAA+ superfamily ATPase
MQQKIHKRTIADQIAKYLPTDDIVVLHGARQVGKTSLLYYFQNVLQEKGKGTVYIDLENSRNVQVINAGVKEFLKFLEEEGCDLKNFNEQKNCLYSLTKYNNRCVK